MLVNINVELKFRFDSSEVKIMTFLQTLEQKQQSVKMWLILTTLYSDRRLIHK